MIQPTRMALIGGLLTLALLAACGRAAPGPEGEADRPVIRVAYIYESAAVKARRAIRA
jgi:hypothetical protein